MNLGQVLASLEFGQVLASSGQFVDSTFRSRASSGNYWQVHRTCQLAPPLGGQVLGKFLEPRFAWSKITPRIVFAEVQPPPAPCGFFVKKFGFKPAVYPIIGALASDPPLCRQVSQLSLAQSRVPPQ